MKLEDIIKNKYAKEVDPIFTQEDWNSFLNHKNRKKKRPILLWILLGLTITLPITYSYLHSTKQTNPSYSEYTNQDILSTFEDHDLTQGGLTKTELLINTPPVSKEPVWLSEDRHRQSKIKHIPAPAQLLEVSDGRPTALNPKDDQRATFYNPEKRNWELVAIPSRKLVPTSLNSTNISLNKPISIPSQKGSWKKSHGEIQLYAGLSHPYHVETVEEKAFQVGSKLYLPVSRIIRLKTGIELGNISFVSKIMNPGIGIDNIEAPSKSARFDHAVVESINLSLELGLDVLLYSKKSWNSYLGISYLTAKEITKDIDYNFQDLDNLSGNDILLSKKDSKKYFVPNIIKFETGLKYESPIGGINFSISYPYQIQNSGIDLLNQLQFNLGFTHVLNKRKK